VFYNDSIYSSAFSPEDEEIVHEEAFTKFAMWDVLKDSEGRNSNMTSALAPILSESLNARSYMAGGEAKIYQCVETLSTGAYLMNKFLPYESGQVNEIRFRTKKMVYTPEGRQKYCKMREEGEQTLVILTHGFLVTTQRWDSIARALVSQGFDVVLPLLPGHGANATFQQSVLETVPHDRYHIPAQSRKRGYGQLAHTIREMVVTALNDLGYQKIVLGGFSAGGAVTADALMLLAADPRVSEAQLSSGALRVAHVVSFFDTPHQIIRMARDIHPLLILKKLIDPGWYTKEWIYGHPYQNFAANGYKAYLRTSRSTEMRLLRYSTKVKKQYKKLAKKNNRASRIIRQVPTFSMTLKDDYTADSGKLLNSLGEVHNEYKACQVEGNKPSGICGTCCDEDACAWSGEYSPDHPADCQGVEEHTDLNDPRYNKCGGSGQKEVYPDGLVHDSLIDVEARAGKKEGWWVSCVFDVVYRFLAHDYEGDVQTMPCSTTPQCSSIKHLVREGKNEWIEVEDVVSSGWWS